jgi:endonuclease YncB( thermonuclease family)
MTKKRKKRSRRPIRRTTRNAILAGLVFILLPVIVVLDRQCGGFLRQSIRQTTYAEGDWRKYHNHTFIVNEVIDGDTLDVDVQDGKFPDTRVRLLGVDTPETKHPTLPVMYYGPEATAFTTEKALDKKVTLELDTVGDIRDRYGRLLAYVILPDGTTLNADLIAQGYGYAYLSFPHSHSQQYEALMDTAIAQKRGLWQSATRDDLPNWLRQKRPDLLRYP